MVSRRGWIGGALILFLTAPALAKDVCYEDICACHATVSLDAEGHPVVQVVANYVFGDTVNIQLVRLPQHATQGYYRAKDVQSMAGQSNPVAIFQLGKNEVGAFRVDVIGVNRTSGEAHVSFGYGCATVAVPPVCSVVAEVLLPSYAEE
jgi:hypothetical protein